MHLSPTGWVVIITWVPWPSQFKKFYQIPNTIVYIVCSAVTIYLSGKSHWLHLGFWHKASLGELREFKFVQIQGNVRLFPRGVNELSPTCLSNHSFNCSESLFLGNVSNVSDVVHWLICKLVCVTVCVLCIYFCVSYTGGSPKYEVVYVDSGLWFETMTVHELSNFQKYFPLNQTKKKHIFGYIRFLSFYAADSNKR